MSILRGMLFVILFCILDVCLHIVLIGAMWVERIAIEWLFGINCMEEFEKWMKKK